MSAGRKYSISVRGHRTSISLEPEFWTAFRALCRAEESRFSEVLAQIDGHRQGSLASAVRLWVLGRLIAGPRR
ncbi:MAG: ribbon-helix-helix domain-containing protein [Alphaproteobacteria bacterium]|jgi:predicted DNA-binding ribbon-helix-helix protein|nr:ribbon-helix-helix domain-containing protein [Alphaproteobacteria bacterium]MDP6515289.1 ribbon-helix-helix domain-containing protein [Alphaproteobacteria bacterium]